MKSRREMLEFVRTGIFSNHLDAYVITHTEWRRLYRVYAEGYPYGSNTYIVELTHSSGMRHKLGFKSNRELLDCYCTYMMVKDWSNISKYSTYNRKLRYR